jgi:lysozyme
MKLIIPWAAFIIFMFAFLIQKPIQNFKQMLADVEASKGKAGPGEVLILIRPGMNGIKDTLVIADDDKVGDVPETPPVKSRIKVSQDGQRFIKNAEGLRTDRYIDVAGVPTIGYGHTDKHGLPKHASMEQIDSMFYHDLKVAEDCIETNVKVPLSAKEHDALISLIFNIGPGAFSRSSIVKNLNAGKKWSAAHTLKQYVYVSKREVVKKKISVKQVIKVHGKKKTVVKTKITNVVNIVKVKNPGLVNRREKEFAMFYSK